MSQSPLKPVWLGSKLVRHASQALLLPIKNPPAGMTRMRIRQRGAYIYFYPRYPGGVRKCLGLLNDDESTIELFSLGNGANYTREIEPAAAALSGEGAN